MTRQKGVALLVVLMILYLKDYGAAKKLQQYK